MLAPGQLIDRYELAAPIGEGGMAHVWAARTQQGQLVALKIIHSRLAEDPQFRTMFLDEGRIVTAVQHPNIAYVFDVGQSGPLLYLAMEYIDGDSLFGLTPSQTTVPLPIALRIAADACAGLHAVHARQIIHRDVSPQNILIARTGEVKLIDFGIAKARDRAAATTAAGQVRGKVRYMAPEQARSEQLGTHTDVFGVGATLFRMLSGRPPYAAATEVETLQALMANAPPRYELPPHIPPVVARVVLRAIAPLPGDRFATVRELGIALEHLLVNEPRPDIARWVNANLSHQAHARLAAPATMRSPPQEPQTKGFMDVAALAQRAREGHRPQPQTSPEQPIELAVPPRVHERPPLPGASRAIKIAVALVAFTMLVVALLLYLPRLVKQRAIATAREAGFLITIDGVGVGISGITLKDLTAQALSTPGIKATIQEVHISGLSMKETKLLGMDAQFKGSQSEIVTALALLANDARTRFAGTPSGGRHVSIASAHLTWDGIVGEGSRLNAGDIGIEFDSHGTGAEEVRGAIGRFELKTETTTLGPWSASLEQTPVNTRIRLMFDPPVPDGPSALVVWGNAVPSELTIKIPRTTFKQLGIIPADLGIPADAQTEFELMFQGRFPAADRSETNLEASLYRARPKGVHGAIDMRVEGRAGGPPGKPLDLDHVTVTLGPFIAAMSGTVTPHEHGLRLNGQFKSLPLSCEKIVKAEAQAMGSVITALQEFAQETGAYRVTGVVNVSGSVIFDTAAPEDAVITWQAKEACGVSLFGK